jgi:hypothetical protein
VYVTFPAQPLATAVTVRQPLAQGVMHGHQQMSLTSPVPQVNGIQRLLHQFSVSGIHFSILK